MKTNVKYILQKLLGFRNYLFLFSLFKIHTLKWDKKENDFLFFLSLIPHNTTVLDIGANIGIMTAHLARKVKGASVFSFELMPNNIHALKRIINYFQLKNVHIITCALGNSEGEAEMVMPVMNSVRMQGLSHVVHESIPENNKGERVRVPLRKLDNLAEFQSIPKISAIKIDVENFEFFVLDGGKELLKKHYPVVYAELWDNENRTKCFELMKHMSYTINVVESNSLKSFNPQLHITQNFIFTISTPA